MPNRKQLLARLVGYELPIEPILEGLAELGFDCEEDLVFVGAGDIIAVVDRCLSGTLTIEQATDWADLLESRDGIGFAQPNQERIQRALFRIANPTLQGPVTLEVLNALRSDLSRLAG